MGALGCLPDAVVAARICTKLDFSSHTRFALASQFYRALCHQPAASPVEITVVDGSSPPRSALDARPWLRPTALESRDDGFRQPAAPEPPFPRRLAAIVRQIVWRASHNLDLAFVVAAMSNLTALSVPELAAYEWRLLVAAAAAADAPLVALERGYVYGPTGAIADTLRFDAFPRLRSLALSVLALVDRSTVRDLARTCPALRDLQIGVVEFDGAASAAAADDRDSHGRNDNQKHDDRAATVAAPLEFAHLERLHLYMSGRPSTLRRSFAQLCATRLPRLRSLELHAPIASLQPLTTFSTLVALEVRWCGVQFQRQTESAQRYRRSQWYVPVELPDPLPALTSLALPALNRGDTDVPRSYAATLTELETTYDDDDVAACGFHEIPRLFSRLRHLTLYGLAAHSRVPASLKILAAQVVAAAATAVDLDEKTTATPTTATRLCTLTLDAVTRRDSYDALRVLRYVHGLAADAYARLRWADVTHRGALEFRCIDRALLDQRVLASQRSFGKWHAFAET